MPEGCVHNGHLFYVKLRDLEQRTAFIAYLKAHGVASSFHYVPLHSAPAGIQYGRFAGVDEYTTKESNRLTRLPLYYGPDRSRPRSRGAGGQRLFVHRNNMPSA